MDATRLRIGGLLEWVLAAAAMVALLAAGSFLVRQLRTVSTATPVIAGEVPVSSIVPPAAVPPGSVSLPLLLLSDGREVRVGETLSAVVRRLGKAIEAAAPAVERLPAGNRITRSYQHDGTRFQLVFEPRPGSSEPRLTAIYR